MAAAKAWAEVEEQRAVEELEARAVAKCKAILAAAEEAETEQVLRTLAKQKGRVEGERLACDRCVVRSFDCQVSWYFLCCFDFSDGDGR